MVISAMAFLSPAGSFLYLSASSFFWLIIMFWIFCALLLAMNCRIYAGFTMLP